MIDLPIGKALIAVHSERQCSQECKYEGYHCSASEECCMGCELSSDLGGMPDDDICGCLCCISDSRRDGNHVVYKIIDIPILSPLN